MTCDFLDLANAGIQKLKPYQPGKPVSELARELGLDEAGIVKLASNENPLGPSPAVLDVIGRELQDISRYPDGSGYRLKKALSEKLGVTSGNITLGNGSNDVLDLLVRAWVAPGDEVIFSEHAFAVYPIATLAASGVPVQVPAVDYGHDLKAMAEAVTDKTKIIFIANPNNPTGTWLSRAGVSNFLEQIPESVLVVLDEAYCEYIDNPDYPDGISWLNRYSNLVITRTFSKIYGLAGLRIGYSVSSTKIADILDRVRQPFNVNSLALAAAEAALSDEGYVQKSRETNDHGLLYLGQGIRKLGLDVIPSLGSFLTFDTRRNGENVFQALLRQGVIVRPVAGYSMPQHLRVSVGTRDENRRFLEALPDALSRVVVL